ncbi:GNAT family N-acetyltransferase [Paenibacillus sp. GSMTC-2017]|uniref:GNAT family N-acetyltransferase n=1 Tax=Paenibacillus sp. GSMTC-2017 TaxID=2794350 RepID=UPI0018D7C9F3|nr:GNAT family N-acetyltransferase [Paenibacillus sp. GSMTC-2017]MBH5316944.1 GNAT family N-acetyltransferase [Paenibacillus sp. GSMTC-2017]
MPVILAKTDEDIVASYPLMKQLRPHLEEENYLCRIKQLQLEYGYNLIVLIEGGEAKASAGYRICDSLAWGKYMYIDDLITDEDRRSRGYAKQLFDWLDDELINNRCVSMHLDSGVHRYDAHRFYLNRKMKITCHHFEKSY